MRSLPALRAAMAAALLSAAVAFSTLPPPPFSGPAPRPAAAVRSTSVVPSILLSATKQKKPPFAAVLPDDDVAGGVVSPPAIDADEDAGGADRRWGSALRSRRALIVAAAAATGYAAAENTGFDATAAAAYSGPTIDVNNAMAREFTAFPGLYPTIATKIVNGAKDKPYASKKDVYAVLTSDAEIERLRQYDAAIVISKPDTQLKQFKASQICKYECGSRTSNAYRDSQIKAVQAGRMGAE